MGFQNDCLSDVLRSMRISGSLLFRDEYAAPWAISIPNADRLRALLRVSAGVRVVAFHFVERGHIEITLHDGTEAVIEAGEIAVCFGGASHRISQGPHPHVLPVDALLTGDGNVFRPGERNRTRSTSLMCGVFLLHDTHLNPLFAALPPLLHASVSHPSGFHNLSGVAGLMAHEMSERSVGSGYVIERLLELLCAEAVRSHIETIKTQEAGWFRGLQDPTVSRAIAMIHARPGESWSVRRLADGVAMSPSRLAARFAAALGESPMAYVAKWRMNVAGRLLDGTQRGISEIAADVGYESVAAFNRAFKRHVGVPPASWRARQRS
ncbi:MAG: AraC family transcriptional regulator [Nitrospirae bacterium]|nr:AraC family transcriptional regulator [Nitrospirota bacterium]